MKSSSLSTALFCILLLQLISIECATPASSMPTVQPEELKEQYLKYQAAQKAKKAKEQQAPLPKDKGISPRELGMKRPPNANVHLTDQVELRGGEFGFGSQLDHLGKIIPAQMKDGADPRKKVSVQPFKIDKHTVTNEQFQDFVEATGYKTEAELYRWSFVLDSEASERTRKEVDGDGGMGRVRDSLHWMGVVGAAWNHPQGLDSDIEEKLDYPAVHISYNDAVEYCAWAGRRLPSEKEWEFAARGGLLDQTYPWGNKFEEGRMNIWEGSDFPKSNLLTDGFLGPAPVTHYEPNAYGLYNMLGNVWEWTKGGTPQKRILRGGSFIDSVDGKYNHIVVVSTRQFNTADSAASNVGFRCASSLKKEESTSQEL